MACKEPDGLCVYVGEGERGEGEVEIRMSQELRGPATR